MPCFEGFEYLWKRGRPKVSTFGLALTPLFLLKMVKIKKSSREESSSYSNMSNEVFISSALSGKNTITFFYIWDIFIRKQSRVTIQRDRIKILQILFHPCNSWSTFYQKSLVPIFSSFAAIDDKGNARKVLTGFLKLAGFLCTIPTFSLKLMSN